MFKWLKKVFFVEELEKESEKYPQHVIEDKEKAVEPATPDFSTMTKLQIDKWAKKNLNIDLDRRRTKEYMIEEIKAHLNKEN